MSAFHERSLLLTPARNWLRHWRLRASATLLVEKGWDAVDGLCRSHGINKGNDIPMMYQMDADGCRTAQNQSLATSWCQSMGTEQRSQQNSR
jgi:hypothetical protein